jgi:hypothetical protein
MKRRLTLIDADFAALLTAPICENLRPGKLINQRIEEMTND